MKFEKRNTYRIPIFALVIAIFFAFSACQQKQYIAENPRLAEMYDIVWQMPDSAMAILMTTDTNGLNPTDIVLWHLGYELAFMKTHGYVIAPSDVNDAIRLTQNMRADYYGNALYLKASQFYLNGMNDSATHYYKLAEYALDDFDPPMLLKANILYFLGYMAEQDLLSQVAYGYYRQAKDWFDPLHDSIQLARDYRDMGRNALCGLPEGDRSLAIRYFDTALAFLPQRYLADRYEIQMYREAWMVPIDSAEIRRLQHLLCDSLYQFRLANPLAEYYLRKGQTDSAKYYLDLYIQYGQINDWDRKRSTYLSSLYLDLIGHDDMAFSMLDSLYSDLVFNMQFFGPVSAYSVNRKYDLEQQKVINKRLANYNLSAKRLIEILIYIIIFVVIIFVFRHIYIRRIHAMQLESLTRNISTKFNSLNERLQLQLQWSRQLSRLKLSGQDNRTDSYPEDLKQYVEHVIHSTQNMQHLVDEFNVIYFQFINHLYDEYPELKEIDVQLLVLSALKLSVEDICIMLDISKRTVWNRRNLLKMHLNLPDDIDLDEWLQQRLDQHVNHVLQNDPLN